MIFTWGNYNKEIHYKKHKIHFGTTAYIFNDPNSYFFSEENNDFNCVICIARHNDHYWWISYAKKKADEIRLSALGW